MNLGARLASIPCSKSIPVEIGWTEDENLLLVLKDGLAMLHDVLGNYIRTLSMLPASQSADLQSVVKATVCGFALVVLTSTMMLQVCNDVSVNTPRVYQMISGISPTRPVVCLAVQPPHLTSSGFLEVFLSTCDKTLIVVNSRGAKDQLLQQHIKAPIIIMALAPNGRFVACFTACGILTVMSTSFTTKILDFDTSSSFAPRQVQWCGEDSVVLCWTDSLLLVGPYGHWLRFPCANAQHIIAEADCCRVLSDENCDLIQRVPRSIEIVDHIASTNLAKRLHNTTEVLLSRDANSSISLSSLIFGGQLHGAIKANISAALVELEPSKQKAYLRAAIYGEKYSLNKRHKASNIVMAARKLRVLNYLRRTHPGLFITFLQFERLPYSLLVSRLLIRSEHKIALSICQYLGTDQHEVLTHWACAKLKEPAATPKSDEGLFGEMEAFLSSQQCPISSVQIAAAAYDAGRTRLATMLLSIEARMPERVKALLAMREYECALSQAVCSMEVDVVYLTLLSIDHTLAMSLECEVSGISVTSCGFVHTYLDALNLLHVYYRTYAQNKCNRPLHNFFVNAKLRHYLEAAYFALQQAYQQPTIDGRTRKMREAVALFAQSRASRFQEKQTEDQIELLRMQHNLGERYKTSCFLDNSVTETIYNLVAMGTTHASHAHLLRSDASRLQRHFKVRDYHVCHIKLRALAASGQWREFRIFANKGRLTIGYKPFVCALVQHKQPVSDVSDFIECVPSVKERFDLLVELKLWGPAFEIALNLKDTKKLHQLSGTCDDSHIKYRIDAHLIHLNREKF